jgi:two-component sensor histidine kinase/sensor domain CHASE-containing protein
LRKKIILLISLTLFLMFAIIAITTRLIILDSFSDLERRYMEKNVGILRSAVNDDLQSLSGTTKDWAMWDETAAFIQGHNPSYIERNLIEIDDYMTLRVDFALFADESARVKYVRALDLDLERDIEIPKDLDSYLSSHPTILRPSDKTSEISGIALLEGGPLLFAACPILNSRGEGPILGTLVMGRFLDAAEIERLAHRTLLAVSIAAVNAPMPLDFSESAAGISPSHPLVIVSRTVGTVSGYSILEDFEGKPALVARIEAPRDIMSQGFRSLGYFTICLALIGIVFGLVVMVFLERAFISRVHSLSAGVLAIGTGGEMSARLPTRGKDEVAFLGAAINGMLDDLERSTEELRNIESRNEAFLSAVPDMIVRLSADGTLLDFRWPDYASLPPLPGEMIGAGLLDMPARYPFIPSDVVRRIRDSIGGCIESRLPCVLEFRSMVGDSERSFEVREIASGTSELILFLSDVTEKKRAAEAQRKEILLKEIHHRVKNNLQVISSLLDLQAKASGDPRMVALLNESRGRLRAMSLIHEKLYQTDAAAGIPMSGYLRELVEHLRNSMLQVPKAVEIQVDVEEIALDMDVAVPCGLIVHELVSNALKHAFPNGREGGVRVRMGRKEGGLFLEVRDNGIGLPDGLRIDSPATLGLRIVKILVSQLKGSMDVGREAGSRFSVSFPA